MIVDFMNITPSFKPIFTKQSPPPPLLRFSLIDVQAFKYILYIATNLQNGGFF
jgi:hypothetical protein